MFKKNHQLDEFFDKRRLEFYENDGTTGKDGRKNQRKVVKEVVLANDVLDCQNALKFHRGVATNATVIVKYGVDGGQGSLKFCMTVECERNDFCSPQKKAPKALQDFKDGGVKKLQIIAIGFDIRESYENIKVFMDQLNIGLDAEATFAVDMKMLNLLLGLQSHASKYPCPWCEGTAPWTTRARLRTLGNIKENQQRWVKSGKGRDKLQQFKNCEHPPLIEGPLDKTILEIFPPPQLHLYMGATNHIKKGIHAALESLDQNPRLRSKTTWAEDFKHWCHHAGTS